ncbi:hypothetical protein KQI84_02595 [bacterium]|nr:hypothetical protein [bacterium]
MPRHKNREGIRQLVAATRHKRLLVLCGIFLALGLVSTAYAQRVRREYPVAPIRVLEHGGEVGVEYNYWGENQRRDNGSPSRFRNHTFQEYFLYRAKGYIYHPRFLDYRAKVKMGFAQQRIRRSSGGDTDRFSDDSFLSEYDLFVTLLKEHPVSFTLFATRKESPIFGLFTDRYMVQSETYGGGIHWANDYVPMNLNYTRSKFKEWGVDSRSETTMDTVEYNASNRVGDWMRSELRYRYQDYTQDFRASNGITNIDRETDFKSHDVSFTNTIFLNESKRSNLTSIGRYFHQRGSQDLDTYSWQERLQLQHTDNLRSYYLASFHRNEFANNKVDTYRAEAGIDHQLYRSLESHLDVHWRRTDFDPIVEDVYGVTGRLDYRKQTGWGFLSAGYAHTLDRVERTGQTGTRFIIDEPMNIFLGVTTYLSNPDVIPTSIVVTNPAGTTTFTEGFDYVVIKTGNRTGLRVLAGGLIADGDPVLVDYSFTFDSDFDYLTSDQNFHIRHDFQKIIKGLAVYYHWRDVTNYNVPSDRNLNLLEYTDQMAGFEYRWRDLTWTEEYQKYRSTYTDYDQFRSRLEGSHRLRPDLRFTWNAGLTLTDYDDNIPNSGGNRDRFYYGGLGLDGRIKSNGYWSLEGRAQHESGRTDRTIYGAVARLGWHWRKVRLEAGARYEEYDIYDSNRDRTHVYVQIARIF